jgi:acyl-coenzyme A synthetase/AMP-(fatty) acid ligase
MGVAVKRLRIGRRREQVVTSSPLELALAPALVDGSWRVPDRFNLTRDLVEVIGRADSKRQALTILGSDGIIEPRTFRQLAEGATRWASILRSKGIEPGDRVVVLSRLNEDWVDIALGCLKIGAIFAPAAPTISPQALESRVAVTDAALVVAGEESEDAIERMSFTPELHHVRSGRMRRSSDAPDNEPTADTFSRDVSYLSWTAGTEGDAKPVAHTHGSLFAARAPAEHWLDASAADLVWCATAPGSSLALTTLAGVWARGAEAVVHEGDFEPAERLDLIRRVGPTVLCQSPAEYRALSELRQLARYRPPRLRRLLTTGDYLEPALVETFRERWELEIQAGYGETETGVVTVTRALEERERAPGEIGAALPGHHLAVVDDQGNELPPRVEGDLAVRGRPPTLFAGYWESPEETKRAFRGDWYLTGDVAAAEEPGVFRFLGRAGELITSRGRTFGPHEVERALAAHDAVATSAVVGVRDLERGGQFVRAFVVLETGVEGSEQLEAELRQFVGQSLAEQQVPREIEFVDGLPRSPSGAVRRLELRDRPVSGRPLWEAPPTSEPEPEPPTTAELATASATAFLIAPEPAEEPELPFAYVEPAPAEEIRAIEEVVAWQEPVAEAVPEPVEEVVTWQEPVAAAAPEPVDEVVPWQEPPAEVIPEPVEEIVAWQEPAAEAAPVEEVVPQEEPIAEAAPEPVDDVVPWPEPVAEAAPEAAELAPTPAEQLLPEGESAADIAPEPTAEAAVEPQVEAAPEADMLGATLEDDVELPVEPAAVEASSSQALETDESAPRHLPEFPEAAELAALAVSSDDPVATPDEPVVPELDLEPEPDVVPDALVEEHAPAPVEAPVDIPAETVDLLPEEPSVAPDSPAENEDPLAESAPPVEEAVAEAATPSEPLPDYIVSPADAYANQPPPLEVVQEPEPEPEDLGPLPEYIVDPDRRLEVVSEAPAADASPPPAPAPITSTEALAGSPLEDHPLAGLARPQVSIPIPDDDETPKSRPRSKGRARSAPTPEPRRKRGRSEGDPGDEGLETGWMQRLSSRLDAYGMSEEAAAEERLRAGEPDPEQDEDAPKKP